MLRIVTLAGLLVFGTALASAETWTGKLLDADCSCMPTKSTRAFALQVAAKLLKLDDAGNRKAAQAMKEGANSANRDAAPNAQETQVVAKVEGTLSGDEIQVSSLELQ